MYVSTSPFTKNIKRVLPSQSLTYITVPVAREHNRFAYMCLNDQVFQSVSWFEDATANVNVVGVAGHYLC